MTNYIVSYDLNGPRPSHAEMDEHLQSLGAVVGRILETVWYVGYSGSLSDLYDHVQAILSSNDLLVVIEARESIWNKLLVSSESLQAAWNQNR